MLLRKRRRKGGLANQERRGATAVEFAFAAPALFLMVFICAEFARLMMIRDLAHHAAYEAARLVIVEGASNQDALEKANEILGRLGTNGATININDGAVIDFDTQQVEVVISVPMAANAFFFPEKYGERLIEAAVTLNTERYTGYFNADDVH